MDITGAHQKAADVADNREQVNVWSIEMGTKFMS